VRAFIQPQQDASTIRPVVSTSVDTAGSTIHVIADSLELSVSVEQVRMLAAFAVGWEQLVPESEDREGLNSATRPKESRPPSLPPLLPLSQSLPPELVSSVPPDADARGSWLGWAFSALLSSSDDDVGDFAHDKTAANVQPEQTERNSAKPEASRLPIAVTLNIMVGAVALVLRRHTIGGFLDTPTESAHSPGRQHSESGVTSSSIDQSTLTVDSLAHNGAAVFELLRVPVARLGIVTIAATPSGTGSGDGRSLRTSGRRLPLPFFRLQVVNLTTVHIRVMQEELSVSQLSPVVATHADCFTDVGPIAAGRWGVESETVHSHHIRTRQLLVREAIVGGRETRSHWTGHSSGKTSHSVRNPLLADLSESGDCDCLLDQACILRCGSTEEVRVASSADELVAHPYFANSFFPGADAVLAGSSAADTGVLHHVSARAHIAAVETR